MVHVCHVLKLWFWCRTQHMFLSEIGVGRFFLITRFPGIWTLSIFLSPHLRTFNLWSFEWSHHVVFGDLPLTNCFQRPLGHFLVDSLKNIRLLILKRIANCCQRLLPLLCFHRDSPDWPDTPNFVKSFPHSSGRAPPSSVVSRESFVRSRLFTFLTWRSDF